MPMESFTASSFPGERSNRSRIRKISSRFLESANFCLEKSKLNEGWKTRAREFLVEDFSSEDATVYDERALNLWLMLYGGYEKEMQFSFGEAQSFFQETNGVFRNLVCEVLADLRPASETGQNPLFTMVQAVSIWTVLAKESCFEAGGSELLRDIINEKLDTNFDFPNLTESDVSDFLESCESNDS